MGKGVKGNKMKVVVKIRWNPPHVYENVTHFYVYHNQFANDGDGRIDNCGGGVGLYLEDGTYLSFDDCDVEVTPS